MRRFLISLAVAAAITVTLVLMSLPSTATSSCLDNAEARRLLGRTSAFCYHGTAR